MFKEKRGELTTNQIVTLVILIASFIIILIFIFLMNFGKTSDRDICHNSVAMRASPVIPGESIPLDCKTNYICITEDGSCEERSNTEKKKVKTKDDVYAILAEQMADCWWMFGEGKLEYVGKDFFFKDNYCSICAQMAFDNSVVANIKDFSKAELNKDDFYNYLAKTKINGKEITYSEYIFGTNNLDKLKQELSKNQSKDVTFGKLDLNKSQYVVMGITSEVTGRGWKIAAASVAGVAGFFLPGLGWTWAGAIAGAVIISTGEYGANANPEILSITVEGNGVKNNFMAPVIIDVNSEKFKLLNCENVETLS